MSAALRMSEAVILTASVRLRPSALDMGAKAL
jgi:hypothetical protein